MPGDIVSFGETMLRLTAPSDNRLETTSFLQVHVAGTESNTLACLARLNMRVSWLSVLPATPLGRHVETELKRHGIDTSEVIWSANTSRVSRRTLQPLAAAACTSSRIARRRSPGIPDSHARSARATAITMPIVTENSRATSARLSATRSSRVCVSVPSPGQSSADGIVEPGEPVDLSLLNYCHRGNSDATAGNSWGGGAPALRLRPAWSRPCRTIVEGRRRRRTPRQPSGRLFRSGRSRHEGGDREGPGHDR